MTCRVTWVVDGEEVSRALDKDRITIGRSADNDISVPNNSVSRRHACILRDGDSWRIEDAGSRNGTRLNDTELPDRPLRNGDVIYLGRTRLAFVDESAGSGPLTQEDDTFDPGMQTVVRTAMEFGDLVGSIPGDAVAKTESPKIGRLVTAVSDASKAILESQSLDDAFRRMLDVIFAQLPAERGFIMLWDEERKELDVRCSKSRGTPGVGAPMRVSRTIAEKVFRETVTVLTTDAQLDGRFASGESVVSLGIRSAIAAPIWRAEKVEGIICLDATVQRAFETFDADLLSAMGHQLAVAIERARLQTLALEKERLDRELAVAREIQIATLPSELPRLPGYELAGLSRPAEATGGDTYDLIPLEDRHIVLLLGDATGHGIGPALSVTQVRAMLRVAMRLNADLDAAFRQINDQLAEDLDDARFVTAFIGLLDGEAHRVRFHAGGQGPIMHYCAADDTFDWQPATTTPMGFMPAPAKPPARVIDFGPGDVLGLMTDGVFEAEDAGGEMFGTARVEQLIRRHAAEPAQRLAQTILLAVDDYAGDAPQADDITIVLVRRLSAEA
jgi:phosphoserine phosphatase